MDIQNTLNLMICYSHADEAHVSKFIKQITPLKTNGLIKEWYDRKIIAGQEYQNSIDNNLNNADIICLFISSNFLSSKECLKEKRKAFDLRLQKGILVIPIILSECGWQDDVDLKPRLAIPQDGKAISSFANKDEAWQNVYNDLKESIVSCLTIKNIRNTEEFKNFLNSTEIFTKVHSQKNEVLLDDIFVFPEITKFNHARDYEKIISSKDLIDNFVEYPKILIAGEDQSGKTTLCKKIYTELRKKNFVPIYLLDKTTLFRGRLEHKIKTAFKAQYLAGVEFDGIDKKRVVPIIDDFHYAKKKDKIIKELSDYCYQIVVVDDIFSLNLKDESLIKAFTQFKIKQFGPMLRNQLIENWVHLGDITTGQLGIGSENKIYREIDSATELVDTALGKIFSGGIMPAYPFFILSIISTYEAVEKPLDQEITSQGYCYQALIYLYLRKQGVKNDEIDTYINFLTEFAFYIYAKQKPELSLSEFDVFWSDYVEKFNFSIKKDVLLKNLINTRIICFDRCNNYSFNYPYLYYFFVAKYLAENCKKQAKILEQIINNLHKNENAYIAIFISHHSKNASILDDIIVNALCLFDRYSVAKLTKDELKFFDEEIESVIKAVLPSGSASPEALRQNRLRRQESIEKSNGDEEEDEEKDDFNNDLIRDLRRSIKTVEVMGSIIKNRAGSLEKIRLEEIFERAMEVHLRILSSFFELIKHKEQQKYVVDFIKGSLNAIMEEKANSAKAEAAKPKKWSEEELEKLSRKIFWNLNFLVIHGVINKIIQSLGSDKLQKIVDQVCDKVDSPATSLVKNGISMWYSKNLQIDNIEKRMSVADFSETAKEVMRLNIVNHCSLHSIGYKERQKIENKLGVSARKLLHEKKE